MGLVARFLQDGEAMTIKTTGCGDYLIAFESVEVYRHFKAQFDNWLVFRNDDARYEWDSTAKTLTIDWYI